MSAKTSMLFIAAAAAATLSLSAAQGASAMTAPIRVTQDVNMRGGPGVGYARVGGVYRSTSPDFTCWTQGQNIGGVDVWFLVNNRGAQGYYASYFDDSTYSSDAQITSKYGIPR